MRMVMNDAISTRRRVKNVGMFLIYTSANLKSVNSYMNLFPDEAKTKKTVAALVIVEDSWRV